MTIDPENQAKPAQQAQTKPGAVSSVPPRGQGATARAAALSARASDVIRGPRRPRNGAPAVGQAQPALPPRLQAAIAGGRMSEDQARQRAMVNAPQYRMAMNAAGGAGMPAQARDWSAQTGDQSYGGQPTLNGPPMAGQGQIPDELRMGMGGANGPQEMLRQRLGQSNGGPLAPPLGMSEGYAGPGYEQRGMQPGGVANMNGGGYQAQPSPLASVFMPQGQGQGGMDLERLRTMISRYQGPQAQQAAATQGAVSSYRY